MAIATTSSGARRSVLRYAPLLALALAVIALALLAVGPIGWRAGWWHFRFAFLTLMPWAAYFGIAALVVSVVTLLLARLRIEGRGFAIAIVAFAAGGDRLCALALRSDPADRAANPRRHDRPGESARVYSRGTAPRSRRRQSGGL